MGEHEVWWLCNTCIVAFLMNSNSFLSRYGVILVVMIKVGDIYCASMSILVANTMRCSFCSVWFVDLDLVEPG